MNKVSFSCASLPTIELILSKYINIEDDFDIFDINYLIYNILSFISNYRSKEMNDDILNAINAKIYKEDSEIFLTKECISEVCDSHGIRPQMIDDLQRIGLEYSASKNAYQILQNDIDDNSKRIDIRLNSKDYDNTTFQINDEISKEDGEQFLTFNFQKLCYKDAVSLYCAYKKYIRQFNILNKDFITLFCKALLNSQMNPLKPEEINAIFKGNLMLLYEVIAICVQFNYQNSTSKKVNLTPIM